METLRQKALNMASGLGEGAAEIQATYDAMQKSHEAIRAILGPAEEAARSAEQMAGSMNDLPLDTGTEVLEAAAANYSKAVEAAAASHNQAAQYQVAKLLAGSKSLQDAFIASADLTGDGFKTLIEQLDKISPELAERLKGVAGLSAAEAKGAAPKLPQVNFNGGQTFLIKQDFRDQDPDRIAVVFRRDVQRQASSRLSASTAMPFGG
jgi:soluble cytochrome b562